MDRLSREARSELMSKIRGKNTKPELAVRSLVHRLGFRFRLHRKDLPGSPDLVFPSRKKVIFVHGCFWHYHSRCSHGRLPKTRVAYWTDKFERNRNRDKRVKRKLEKLGWRVFIVWECELHDLERICKKLQKFLE